jgi:hypothetical protein
MNFLNSLLYPLKGHYIKNGGWINNWSQNQPRTNYYLVFLAHKLFPLIFIIHRITFILEYLSEFVLYIQISIRREIRDKPGIKIVIQVTVCLVSNISGHYSWTNKAGIM